MPDVRYLDPGTPKWWSYRHRQNNEGITDALPPIDITLRTMGTLQSLNVMTLAPKQRRPQMVTVTFPYLAFIVVDRATPPSHRPVLGAWDQ